MIAITGADGFLGKHCRIYCKIKNIKNVLFINKKNHKKTEIINKLKFCKIFIHLAGINRIKKGKIGTDRIVRVGCKHNLHQMKNIVSAAFQCLIPMSTAICLFIPNYFVTGI